MSNLPGTRLYGLTAKALDDLREDIRRGQQRVQNPRREGTPDRDLEEMPSVIAYLARTPEDGLPGMNLHTTGTGTVSLYDNEPGHAVCEVWRILPHRLAHRQGASGTGLDTTVGTGTSAEDNRPELTPVTGLTRTVYNYTTGGIAGDTWLLIVKDPWGSWLAAPSGGDCDAFVCSDSVYDECHRRLVRVTVACVSGDIVVTETVQYERICHGDCGDKVHVSDTRCPGESTGTGTDCSACEGSSDPGDTVTLTVAGFSNNVGCSDCANADGTWTLTRQSDPAECSWESDTFAFCGDTVQWSLAYDAASKWTLRLTATVSFISPGATDCSLPADLAISTSSMACNFPGSVTIS